MQNIIIDFDKLKKIKAQNILKGIVLAVENNYSIYYKSESRDEIIIFLENEKLICKSDGNINFLVNLPVNANNKEEYDLFKAIKKIVKPERTTVLERKTNETKIKIMVNLDKTGRSRIKTGIGFFDHMLEQIAKHSNMIMDIKCKGDLEVDEHHTVEDTGLALGEAILKSLGDKKGITRFGFILPMDDAIAQVALDLGGRPYLNYNVTFTREKIGDFPVELAEEFFRALASGLKANIYIDAKGKNEHHKTESIFKAFGKALNEAVRIDDRNKNSLPTTKGLL